MASQAVWIWQLSSASLDPFHLDLVAIVAYLELPGCALPVCSPGFLGDGRYMVHGTWCGRA